MIHQLKNDSVHNIVLIHVRENIVVENYGCLFPWFNN